MQPKQQIWFNMFARKIFVPNRIVVAFVAELRMYGFWRREEVFAELWRILENNGSQSRIGFVARFARRVWLREELGRRAVTKFAW